MIKKYKILLNFTLCLSLILMPTYGYPDSSKDDSPYLNQLIQHLQDQTKALNPPSEFKEASRILLEMGEALQEGKFKEYLDNHPNLRSQFDILSLQDQEVRIINQKTNAVAASMDFNDYIPEYYPVKIQNVEVGFDRKNKLTFYGVTVKGDEERAKEIGITHHFKNIDKKDIVNWAYDKELLVVLHKTKGLMVFHMVFAETFMGETPIPSIIIPGTESFSKIPGVKLSFIDRSVESPLKPRYPSKVGLSINSDKNAIMTSGDLVISSQIKRGQKKIERVFPRVDLYTILTGKYIILQLLLQLVTVRIDQERDAQNLNVNIDLISRQSSSQGGVGELLSSILNREPLLFLSQISDKIIPVIEFLDFNTTVPRDEFLYSQWAIDFKKIKSGLNEEQKASLKKESQKRTGFTLSSEEISTLLSNASKETPKEEKKWIAKLKKITPKKSHKRASTFIKFAKDLWSQKLDITVALIAGSFALVHITGYSYEAELSSSTIALYNMLLFGVGILASIATVSYFSIPTLKKLEKIVPRGRLKTKINQTIEKWEHQDTKARIVGFGFKLAASLLYPLWSRIAQTLGQPHFFRVLAQGLNPFKIVDPQSSLGRAVRLKQPQMLGVNKLHKSQWSSKTKAYQQSLKLIDAEMESNKRIRILSRMLTYYAMLGEGFEVSSLSLGVLPFLTDSEMKKKFMNLFSDKKQHGKFMWVSYKLSQYIKEMNNIDATQSIFQWEPELIQTYYDKAVELSYQNVSLTRLQIHKAIQWSFSKMRQGLQWNQEASYMLSQFTPEKSVSEYFWIQLLMDHITIVTFPLTPLTPRGDMSLANNDLGIANDPTRLYASPPHFHEGVMNAGIHTVYSARTEMQYVGVTETLKKHFEEFLNLYKPLLPQAKKQQSLKQLIKALFGKTDPTESNEESSLKQLWAHMFKAQPGQQSVFNYLWEELKFPFTSGGAKLREGTPLEERIDAGDSLWRFIRIGYRFLQVTLIIGISSRLTFTEQPVLDALLGAAYFQVAGILYYGWPMVWAMTFNGIAEKKLALNKEFLAQINRILYKIKNNLYTSRDGWKADYNEVLLILRNLFQSNKKFFKEFLTNIDLDPVVINFLTTETINEHDQQNIESYIKNLSLKKMKNEAEKINKKLKNIKNLPPMEVSKLGQMLSALLALGIFSNIAFVYLSIITFTGDVTVPEIIITGILVSIGAYAYNRVMGKTLSEHKEWLQSKIPEPLKKAVKKITFQPEFINEDIEQVLISIPANRRTRLVRILKENNIMTTIDLMSHSKKDLLGIEGLGKVSVDEIIRVLSEKKIQLVDSAKQDAMIEGLATEVDSESKAGRIQQALDLCRRVFAR